MDEMLVWVSLDQFTWETIDIEELCYMNFIYRETKQLLKEKSTSFDHEKPFELNFSISTFAFDFGASFSSVFFLSNKFSYFYK